MNEEKEIILRKLPFYDKLTDLERRNVLSVSGFREYGKGEILHDHRSDCLGLIYVKRGHVRVTMQSDEGREITLYTLSIGDSDVLSASCVINQITFETYMEAEEDSEVLILPASYLSDLKEQNLHVKCFILTSMADRFSDVMWTMQQILFKKADQRVAVGLIEEFEISGNPIRITQEQLAKKISSAREVVTRILKRFEKDGKIRQRRGTIEVLDIAWLKELC